MTAAGIIALLGLAVTVASLVWLHLQPTKLSPMHDPVSEYGITIFRAGYRAATIAFGAAGLALAAGIGQPALRAWFGTIERGFYLFAITWCAVCSRSPGAPCSPSPAPQASASRAASITGAPAFCVCVGGPVEAAQRYRRFD